MCFGYIHKKKRERGNKKKIYFAVTMGISSLRYSFHINIISESFQVFAATAINVKIYIHTFIYRDCIVPVPLATKQSREYM
jgi:hypothetical protein